MKHITKILMALVIMIALVGAASATILPNATKETTTNGVVTSVTCDGIVLASEEYCNEQTNQVLDGAPLSKNEVYGTSVYTNKIMAVKGITTYVKTIDMNTKNSALGQSNIETDEQLYFEGEDGGQTTGAEEISTFNAGMATTSKDTLLCPFSASKDPVNPPFNVMVQSGSKFDVYSAAIATQVGATTVAETGDIPLTVDYNIDATGLGSVTAYTSVYAQEARGDGYDKATTAKPKNEGGNEYVQVGGLTFAQYQNLYQGGQKATNNADVDQNGVNVNNGGNGGKGGNADADALAIALANAEATATNGGKDNNNGKKNTVYCPVPDPTTNVNANADADALAIAGALAIGGNGGKGGNVDQDVSNNLNLNQNINQNQIGANIAIQNIYLPTEWRIGNDGKIYAPVKAPVITPSSNTAYKDSTTAMGNFAFHKNMKFTSGIAA
jgi:hypothetical protein